MKSFFVYIPSLLVLVLIGMMLHMHASSVEGSKLTAERHSQEANAVCPCK